MFEFISTIMCTINPLNTCDINKGYAFSLANDPSENLNQKILKNTDNINNKYIFSNFSEKFYDNAKYIKEAATNNTYINQIIEKLSSIKNFFEKKQISLIYTKVLSFINDFFSFLFLRNPRYLTFNQKENILIDINFSLYYVSLILLIAIIIHYFISYYYKIESKKPYAQIFFSFILVSFGRFLFYFFANSLFYIILSNFILAMNLIFCAYINYNNNLFLYQYYDETQNIDESFGVYESQVSQKKDFNSVGKDDEKINLV